MHPSAPRSDGRSWHAVQRYEWRTTPVEDLDAEWEPSDPLTVVIPAFECQPQLDLTLAALRAQRYPPDLLEVIVADDGSAQPLHIPDVAPPNTRLLRLDRTTTWGRARACAAGAEAAAGDILLFLDADMIVFPDHLRAHARWHHVLPDAVTMGRKRFVDTAGITVADVAAAAGAGRIFELLEDRPHQDHDWVDKVIADTDDLTRYHPEMFRAAVGANVGMRRALYQECGGFRAELRAGEDMEMGYRLMAAGAVFIPERGAQSWHQGPATFMSDAEDVRRRNNPHFADLIAVPGRFRPRTPGRLYTVPMITILTVAVSRDFESVKRCIDSVLGSSEHDLRVHVDAKPDYSDRDLLQAEYRGDPRVGLGVGSPESGFPSRFTIWLPEGVQLAAGSLGALVKRLESDDVGLMEVVVPAPNGEKTVLVWRTAALHRARRHERSNSEMAADARLFGVQRLSGRDFGMSFGAMDLGRPRSIDGTSLDAPSRRRRATGGSPDDLRLECQRLNDELADLRRRHEQLRLVHRRLRKRYHRLRARRVVRAVDAFVRMLRSRR